ncbi:hypothetical protein D3C86_1219720 [compost metagenome]
MEFTTGTIGDIQTRYRRHPTDPFLGQYHGPYFSRGFGVVHFKHLFMVVNRPLV